MSPDDPQPDEMDPYDLWANAAAEEQYAEAWRRCEEERRHRCDPDVPPCPMCQDLDDLEAEAMRT